MLKQFGKMKDLFLTELTTDIKMPQLKYILEVFKI